MSNKFNFGEAPEGLILDYTPYNGLEIELDGEDAKLVNAILYNKERDYLKTHLNRQQLVVLLRSLRDVALENTTFWTREEAEIAYSIRCSILLELGIHEL